MSYKKLDIKDFVDKWDVSKVRHLEDAIIENEKAINNISLTPGPQGEQGPRGEQGIQGEQGLQGEQGVPGKSAYEYAKEAGYSGSEEEFSQKLNQANLSLDNTLSIEGAAADAKAVGEAISSIEIPVHSWDTLENKPFGELLSKEPINDSFNPLSEYPEGSTIDINRYMGHDFKMLSETDIDESLWPSLLPLPLIVVFDGKEYMFDSITEITRSGYHYRIIGNASLYKEEYEDTYEPFCIIITNIDDRVVVGYNTEISLYCKPEYYGRTGVDFEVYKVIYELKQLDDKFISDNIARTANVPSVDATFSQSGAAADALVTGNNIKNIGKTVSSLERVSRYLTGSDWYLKIDTINNTVTIPAGLLMSGTWGLPITEQTIDISQEYDTTLVVYDSSTSAIRNISCTEFVAKSMYIIATITRDFYDKPNYNQIQGPYMVDGVMINSMAHTTTTVIDDITETPTAEQFNALLQVLRNSGILASN